MIEDHPGCNGTGETAFEVALDAPEMEFDLRGVDGHNVAYVGDSRWDDTIRRACYITQRRGAEVVQIEIPCNPSQTLAELQQRMDELSVTLDFSGTVAICQSLTDQRLLEGRWTATLGVDGQSSRIEGDFATSTEFFCPKPEDRAATRVALTYARAGLIGNEAGPFERSVGFYQLRIRDMPIDIADADGIEVDLRGGATFFPVFDGRVECSADGCNRMSWNSSGVGSYWWSHRNCQ